MQYPFQSLRPVLVLLFACALPVGAVTAAPKVVRIGYQKSGFLLLVRGERTLEKRLEPLGYGVEWREFTSGPPLLEAMNSGAVDFGHTGQPPPVFAQVNGVPFLYVATTESSPESSGLLVPQNSPLQTVADLKGKRLAFARGSSSHLFVAQRLLQAGLTFADVKPVYLQPAEARAAFLSGAVDAWAVWDPFFAAAEIQLNARALTTGRGLTGFREFYFARKDYLDSPAAETLPVILATLREAGQRVQADLRGTAALLADKLGLPAAVLERSEARTRYHALLPITPAIAADARGFYGVLLPTGRSCEDAWVVTSSLIPETSRLRFLVAVRPGLISPTLAARMCATFDRLSGGRLLIDAPGTKSLTLQGEIVANDVVPAALTAAS